MSRKPLVNINEAVDVVAKFPHPVHGALVTVGLLRAVLEDVITIYEAALDGANERIRDDYNSALNRIISLSAENDELRKRIADLEAEKDALNQANIRLCRRLDAIIQSPRKLAIIQNRGIFSHDPDGPSSEERVRRSRDGDDLDMTHRRIDKLSDRVAQLERAQREGQGEL